MEAGLQTIGVAFRRGCLGSSETLLQFVTFDEAAGQIELQGSPLTIDDDSGSGSGRRPQLAFWPASNEWLFAAQRGHHSIHGVRLSSVGTPIDDTLPLLLVVPDSASQPRLSDPFFLFLDESAGFRVIVPIPGDIDPGFWGARVTCSGL